MTFINLCPTGMIPTKKMTPHVPIDPGEIVDQVLRISPDMVHIHARDSNGIPTWEPSVYQEIIDGIKRVQPQIKICVSTSGRTFRSLEMRSAALECEGVDMASLTLSSLNFNKISSINEPDMIIALAERMGDRGIQPELEVFDSGMINFAHYLIKKKLISPPYYFNLILGNISCMQPSMLGLGYLLSLLPQPCQVAIGGIGQHQQYAHRLAFAERLGYRVGLEDNIWYDQERTVLATNKMLVDRLRERE